MARRPPVTAGAPSCRGATRTGRRHMSDDVEATNSGGQEDDRPPGWRLTRRTFLAGCAAVAGAAAVAGKVVDDTFLGGLQPAAAAAPTVPEQLVRTGHSNNCDGACGHLVHVADGKVKLVEGAPYDKTTIDGHADPPVVSAAHLPARRGPAREPLQRRPHQVPVQAGRRARLGPVAAHQLGRGDHDDRRQPARRCRPSTARTRSGSRPTPARSPSSRGSSASAFASPARSAPWPATSRATTRATAPRRPAGTTCSSTRPTPATAAASSTVTNRPTSSTPR